MQDRRATMPVASLRVADPNHPNLAELKRWHADCFGNKMTGVLTSVMPQAR